MTDKLIQAKECVGCFAIYGMSYDECPKCGRWNKSSDLFQRKQVDFMDSVEVNKK